MIFPYTFCRSAGIDFNITEKLSREYKKLDSQLIKICSDKKILTNISLDLVDILFNLIKIIESKKERQILIDLKREIFNLKEINLNKTLTINRLNKILFVRYDKYYHKCINNSLLLNKLIKRIYDKELSLLEQLSKNDTILRGISITSIYFFEKIRQAIFIQNKSIHIK